MKKYFLGIFMLTLLIFTVGCGGTGRKNFRKSA